MGQAKAGCAAIVHVDGQAQAIFIAARLANQLAHLQGQHETALAVRDAERVARIENDIRHAGNSPLSCGAQATRRRNHWNDIRHAGIANT